MSMHGVAGVWILVAMLGLSATGLTWSAATGNNVDTLVASMNWKADPIDTSLLGATDGGEDSAHAGHENNDRGTAGEEAEAKPMTGEMIAEQAATVLQTARDQGLTGSLRLFPPEDTSTAWQASERWVNYRMTSDAITVDGSNGDVVDRLDFADLPLFSKLTSWGIYLHMGIMFGLPLQLVLCAVGFSIAGIVVLGYLMWWKRRPTPGGIAGIPGPRVNLTKMDWIIIAVFLATVGTFIPLLGVSLLVMIVVDRVLAARARKVTTKPVLKGLEEAVREQEDDNVKV